MYTSNSFSYILFIISCAIFTHTHPHYALACIFKMNLGSVQLDRTLLNFLIYSKTCFFSRKLLVSFQSLIFIRGGVFSTHSKALSSTSTVIFIFFSLKYIWIITPATDDNLLLPMISNGLNVWKILLPKEPYLYYFHLKNHASFVWFNFTEGS